MDDIETRKHQEFQEHIEKCADLFQVPQEQREAYLKHLTATLEKIHSETNNSTDIYDNANNATSSSNNNK